MVQRLIYTSCRQSALEKGSGDRVFTITEGLKDKTSIIEVMKDSREFSLKSTKLPLEITEENKHLYPVAYRYFHTDVGDLISSIRYIGKDWNNDRYGNKLACFMTTENISDYPIVFCNEKYFPEISRESISSENIPDYLEEIELSEVDKDELLDRITEFLDDDDRSDVFVQLICALVYDPTQQIEIYDSKDNLYLWVAAITLFFPLEQSLRIYFNTYEDKDRPSKPTTLMCYLSESGKTDYFCKTGEGVSPKFTKFLREVADDFYSYFEGPNSFRTFMRKNQITAIDLSIIEYMPLFEAYSNSHGRAFKVDDALKPFILSHINNLDPRMLKFIVLGLDINEENIKFADQLMSKINDPELEYSYNAKKDDYEIGKIRNTDTLASNDDAKTYKKLLLSITDSNGLISNKINEKELFIILKLCILEPKENWNNVYLVNKKESQLCDPYDMIISEQRKVSCEMFWKYVYLTPIEESTQKQLKEYAADRVREEHYELYKALMDFDRTNGYRRLGQFCTEFADYTIRATMKYGVVIITPLMFSRLTIFSRELLLDLYESNMTHQIRQDIIEKLDKMVFYTDLDFKNGEYQKESDYSRLKNIIWDCYERSLLPRYRISKNEVRKSDDKIPFSLLTCGFVISLNKSLREDDRRYSLDNLHIIDARWLQDNQKRSIIEVALETYWPKGLSKDKNLKSCNNLYDTLIIMFGKELNLLTSESRSYIIGKDSKGRDNINDEKKKKIMTESHDTHLLERALKEFKINADQYRIAKDKIKVKSDNPISDSTSAENMNITQDLTGTESQESDQNGCPAGNEIISVEDDNRIDQTVEEKKKPSKNEKKSLKERFGL